MDMKDLLGKKSKEVDPLKKEAKLKALKELRAMASGMGGDDVKSGLEKVTVAATDKAGLKKGLDKAKEVVDTGDFDTKSKDDGIREDAGSKMIEDAEEASGIDLDDDQELGESSEHQDAMLDACNDPDEIDAMMKKLEEKKKALLSNK